MINYSRRLGENMFDKLFPTSPGRVDPSTGLLVTTAHIPMPDFRNMTDERWRSQGRGPERGYERGPWSRGEGREEGFPRRGEYEGSFPRMRGSGLGQFGEETGLLQNPALWLILGTGILIALEVNGVTHLSTKA